MPLHEPKLSASSFEMASDEYQPMVVADDGVAIETIRLPGSYRTPGEAQQFAERAIGRIEELLTG